MSSIEDVLSNQRDEFEALKSMYLADIEEDLTTGSPHPRFTVKLYPQRGSSAGTGIVLEDEKNITFVKLIVGFPPKYPTVIPKMSIKEYKGLSAQEIEELIAELKKTAQEKLGDMMMYDVLQRGEEYLYSHQKKPTGSFYDEMLIRNKQVEEKNLQQQMLYREKERLAMKEEILRKQEEVREELRRRRELWKTSPEPHSPGEVTVGSPIHSSDSSLYPMKHGGSFNRRKRRSLSSRRRRSTSEGSDSSLTEDCSLTVIEYLGSSCISNKIPQVAYKGELIGRSPFRGSTVYAGISKNGMLVAIHEWKFLISPLQVDNEGCPLTVEGLAKQIQGFETEFNCFSKLEHSNIILYHGMKVQHSPDEPGVVYLYIIQEFVRGHTVKSYLQDPQQLCSMALPLLRHITNGILEALKFLHDNNIAHRFLRDTSIFLDVGDEVKIADYGIERKVCELYKSILQLPDTHEHFPPSVGRGGKKGDIYRLGVIVLSLLKGRYLSDDNPDIPSALPPEIQDFLKKCLSTLENNRWTASALLEHPFLKMSIKKGPTIQGLVSERKKKNENEDEEEEEEENEEDEDLAKVNPRLASALSAIPVSGNSRLHSEFLVQQWLGKGGFGDVLKVKNKLDGRIYALKRIKLNPRNKQLNKKITREVKLLSQLNHENVVRYFNSWIETVEEEETDETSTYTETVTTSEGNDKFPSSPNAKKEKIVKPAKENSSVRFKLNFDKKNQNSLGLMDNIEEMAPPPGGAGDSEWSVSLPNGTCDDEDEDGDDSEDSSDELDLFGTSFMRLTTNANDDSEDDILFESDSRRTSEDTGTGVEDSSQNIPKQFKSVELSVQTKENAKDRKSPSLPDSKITSAPQQQLPGPRLAQYMYIQMEFCEKSTLRQAIDDNLFEDVDRAWRLFREIVEGLVHIHQQGMIHRDLKPVNVFLDSGDHVKIGDFGLATSSILPKLTVEASQNAEKSLNEVNNANSHRHNQSVDFPEESQTGQVGTALYVAPELIVKASKITYNQKVDIYSLGIIFFEMFYRPLSTGMERVRVISALRLPSITFPSDYDDIVTPQVTHITKWLLNHEPSKRPTSLELLQSDYLPPPHLEEAELRDIFSRTLKNSQSKAYKFLIASCFLQGVSPVEDYTFDMENTRFNANTFKCFHFVHRLKTTIQKVFEKHGGLEVGTPLLMPKSPLHQESGVYLMSHSGNLVCLPHDLRTPFARYVGRYGIRHMKRYAIEKVFRERKVYGLHPRELMECAFDIVDCTPGSLITDAEILSIAMEVVGELPWLRNKPCTIRLGHTKLLEGLLLHHGIDQKGQKPVKQMLAEIKLESSSSKNQIQTYLVGKGYPENFISMLFQLMEVEGSLAKISNLFKSITKRKSEAASLIKTGLHELEILVNHLEHLGLKSRVAVAPTMVFASHIYSGLLFQVVCSLKRKKNKTTMDVIAAGGRYDELIESFRSSLALEPEMSSLGARDQYSQCGVGISLSFDKLVAGYDGEDCQDWDKKGTVHAVICSAGHHPMSKEKLELMKELWAHGIKCTVFECSQTLEEAEEQCKESGAKFMLILKENEFYSTIRVKMLERGLFKETKMSKQEAVEFITRHIHTATLPSENSSNGPNSSHLSRSESSSGKMGTMLLSSSLERERLEGSGQDRLSSGGQVGTSAAMLNISFIVQEKEKVANWKKRYENQVLHHVTDLIPKLAKQQSIEVLGLDVNSTVVKTLASCLGSLDKDEFHKGVSEAIEKHPRLRKYLQNICDEVYELWFEKNAAVIILYGLTDNSYRVLL